MKSSNLVRIIALFLLELIVLYPVSFVEALSISNINITDISGNSARVKWSTDEVANGKVKYGTTANLGLLSTHSTYIFEHSQLLQGLDSEKTYFFEVESSNIKGQKLIDDNDGNFYSFTTKDVTPPNKVAGLGIVGTEKNSIEISWQRSEADDLSHYNIYRDRIKIANTSNLKYTDSNLKPGTAFSYKVSAVDESGNEGSQSDTLIVSTDALDFDKPVISNVDIAESKEDSATITWQTNENTTSIVYYGIGQELGKKEESGKFVINHSIKLESLEKGAVYSFIASSCDKDENCINSSVSGFESGSDAKTPRIETSIPRFFNKNQIDISGATEPFSSVKIFVNDLNVPARALDSKETSIGKFEFLRVNLEKENVIKISVTDKSGNKNESIFRLSVDTENPQVILGEIRSITSNKNATIFGTVDEPVNIKFFLRSGTKEKPGRITGLSAKAENNSIKLEWNESKDKDFSHYIIYRSDVGAIAITEPASYNTYTDILVNKNEQYTYFVTVASKFGKESDQSNSIRASVQQGKTNVPKPLAIQNKIIEEPELNVSVNASFSESLIIDKDGLYTLLIEVLDRASNRVLIEKAITLDTKKPDIKINNPPTGTMIFENYANELDIKGVTEPNAKVHLFIERTPFGFLNRSFDISGLTNELENIPDSKLEADCELDAGGKNFCPESADFSTIADASGNFEFENVDVTSIAGGGINIIEIPGIQLSEDDSLKESKTSRLIFVATDQAGLRNAKEHRIRIGTCYSGNQTFDLIPLTEFQSPTLISPQRLAENKESIYFFFNYTYIGRGSNPKIESVSIQKACSGTEILGDKRFNTSCKILPPGASSTAVNPEGTVSYTAVKLNRVENMDKFLDNDWQSFFGSLSNELTFPLKVTIRYKHTVDGKEVREVQTTCQEVTYVLDNSLIDPRNTLPDWLLYDFVDFLQHSIQTINDINEQLGKVVEFLTIGCVSSFFIRTGFQVYRRFISFSEEKMFQLKDATSSFIPGTQQIKFNVKEQQDQEYCNLVAQNIKKAYKIADRKENSVFGLKLKYFSDKDLKRCFPNLADAWDTEAFLYKAYRYTCDRVFGHQTPSAWTENLDDEKIYQRLLEGNQCPNDQSVYGRPIQAVKCRDVARQFRIDPSLLGIEDDCFVVPVGNVGTRERGNQLFQLGRLAEGTQNVYEINSLTSLSQTKTRYAIKQTDRQYLTNRPETCQQICTGNRLGTQMGKDTVRIGDKIVDIYLTRETKNLKKNEPADPNKGALPICTTTAQCNQWAAEKPEAEFGDEVIKINSAKRQGYTQDCFLPDDDPSTVSDNPQARYECCCLNSQSKGPPSVYYLFDDTNRYENDKGAKESAFVSNKNLEAPENFADSAWSYRYWKESYIALSKETTSAGRLIEHNKYNPNRYIEGRDYPACFGQNNYLYEGLSGPSDGETGKLVMIDSRQQHESAFFCANVAGIRNRLIMLNNMQGALARCLIDIRETGTSDAAACKEFFTRYVCSAIWQGINFAQTLFSDSCSMSSVGLEVEDEDDYTATVRDGFRSVTQSITDAQSELAGEYGNAELNNLLGTGAGEIARKVCLAAFGYDWDLNLQNLVDAAYSQSFETLVQKITGTREYLTIDPTNAQARYEYRSSWIINPGCDIESYKVELACVSRNELNREGSIFDPGFSISPSRGIRCDAVNSPDGNNCDCLNQNKEQVRTFFTSKGKLPQNKLVQQAYDEVVSSLYRYDHMKFTLRPDRKLKGSLTKTCFPPGHEDGVFYFPLSDKTARDIAACKLEPVSGVFECGAADFWSKKGLANIVDITINGEKPIDNSFNVFRGEPLVLTPTIFKTPGSPNKCLVMEVQKQGFGTTSQVETINVDGMYQYTPITLEENVQLIQNIGILPSSNFVRCESLPNGRACQDIVSRQRPTFTALQRDNIQEVALEIKFIDENKDGRIEIDENSQDIMDIIVLGSAPNSKILGKPGWYDATRKRPVIELPEYSVRLQINSVPFASEVESVTYSQIIPIAGQSATVSTQIGSSSFISDNIWRLSVRLFEAEDNTFLCSRFNAGQVVQYQGAKQEKTYTIRVSSQRLDADAPKIAVSFDKENIRSQGDTARLTVDVTDETKVGNINFELTKPGMGRSNWDSANNEVKSLCTSTSFQGSGDRKVCMMDVDGNKLEVDKAGTYRVTVTAYDEDRTSHSATREATIEVLCGPSSDNSLGTCMQGGRCGRESVLQDVNTCQQGFECCRRFAG